MADALPSDQWFINHQCRCCGGHGGRWIWEGSWWAGGEVWSVCGACQGSGIRDMNPKQLAEYLWPKGQRDG